MLSAQPIPFKTDKLIIEDRQRVLEKPKVFFFNTSIATVSLQVCDLGQLLGNYPAPFDDVVLRSFKFGHSTSLALLPRPGGLFCATYPRGMRSKLSTAPNRDCP